jgi:hypothetical protein
MELQANRFILSQLLSSKSSGLSSRVKSKFIWTSISMTSHFHMRKLPFPSNFSTSNLVLDTGMYCGGILAFPADLSSRISAIRTPLDYKWSPKIVKTRIFMLKRAKTVTLTCCFIKCTPRLRPEWLKMLGKTLTHPKTGQKITELAKKPI